MKNHWSIEDTFVCSSFPVRPNLKDRTNQKVAKIEVSVKYYKRWLKRATLCMGHGSGCVQIKQGLGHISRLSSPAQSISFERTKILLKKTCL